MKKAIRPSAYLIKPVQRDAATVGKRAFYIDILFFNWQPQKRLLKKGGGTMAIHPLFQNTRGWDMSWLGGQLAGLTARNYAVTSYGSGVRYNPNSFVANALIEYNKGEAGSVAFIRTATNCYCAEQKHSDGSFSLFQLMANGQCKGAEVSVAGRYAPLDSVMNADQTTIMACMIMALADEDPDAKAQLDACVGGDQAALTDAIYWF